MAILKDRYSITRQSGDAFTFTSDGPNGSFLLFGDFHKMDEGRDQFVFGFGLLTEKDGLYSIDDEVKLNNGDADKIFNTVAHQIYLFMKGNPKASVFIYGSTRERTRKYRQMISRNYEEIFKHFRIYGILPKNQMIPFTKNTPTVFEKFLIQNN